MSPPKFCAAFNRMPAVPRGLRPLIRGLAANLAGPAISAVVLAVTTPLYLRVIGLPRFGALALFWLLTGYFGVFHVGLSAAACQALAGPLGRDRAARGPLVRSALAISAIAGLLGGACLWAFGRPILQLLIATPSAGFAREAVACLPWLAAAVPLAAVASALTGVMDAGERFVTANAIQTGGSAMNRIFPLAAALLIAPQLPVLIAAGVLAQAVAVAALAAANWADLGSVGRGWGAVPHLLRYTLWASVSGAVSPLLTSLDRVAVSASLGAATLGIYSVPMSVCSRLTTFTAAFCRTIFPRLSARRDSALSLARRSLAVLAAAWTPLVLAGVLLMRLGLRLWLGGRVSDLAAPIGIVLLAGVWANGLAAVPFAQSYSQARPDRVAKVHLLELLPFLGLLWLGLRWWGMLGAALAWDARVIADAWLLFYTSGFRVGDLRGLGVPALLLAAAVALALHGFRVRTDWLAGAAVEIGSLAWAARSAGRAWSVGKLKEANA